MNRGNGNGDGTKEETRKNQGGTKEKTGTKRNKKTRNEKENKFEERINFAPEADPTLRLKKFGFAW